MRVLERVAVGVAARCAPTAQIARQKIRQRSKIQPATITGIKKLTDGGAAELVTDFQIVARKLPRKIVNQLIVYVSARAWHREGSPDVGNAEVVMDANERQAEILRVSDSRVQTDRARIEVAVLRKEPFFEAVVAK